MGHCLLVEMKLGELDINLLKVDAERDKTQKKLNEFQEKANKVFISNLVRYYS